MCLLLHPGPRLSFGIASVGVAGLGIGVRGCKESRLCRPSCAGTSLLPRAVSSSLLHRKLRRCGHIPGPRRQTIRPPSHPPRSLPGNLSRWLPGPGFPRKGEPPLSAQESLHSKARTVSGVRVQGRNQGNAPAFHRRQPPSLSTILYTWVPERGINLHADRLLGRVLKKKM